MAPRASFHWLAMEPDRSSRIKSCCILLHFLFYGCCFSGGLFTNLGFVRQLDNMPLLFHLMPVSNTASQDVVVSAPQLPFDFSRSSALLKQDQGLGVFAAFHAAPLVKDYVLVTVKRVDLCGG